MTPPSLNELPSHAEALPSLPEVVSYLMHSFKDDSADVDTIAHHINSDPAIVGRLLAAANSAASGLSTRIFSAKQAFMVLGADRVVSIILASALAYRYEVRGKAFDSYLLWQHSIGVATCARALAEQNGRIDPELAFTCGLLHDIGQILMYVVCPTHYTQVLERHQRDDAFAEQAALHEHLGQEYRQPAFEQIAQEGQRGRLFVAAAQDVGRARVLGAVAARIGQPEHTAGDHGKRYGAEQVGGEQGGKGDRERGHGEFGRSSVDDWVKMRAWRKGCHCTLPTRPATSLPAAWTSSLSTNSGSRR